MTDECSGEELTLSNSDFEYKPVKGRGLVTDSEIKRVPTNVIRHPEQKQATTSSVVLPCQVASTSTAVYPYKRPSTSSVVS